MRIDILLSDALGDVFFSLGACWDIANFHRNQGDYVRLVTNSSIMSFIEKTNAFDSVIVSPNLHGLRHPIKNYFLSYFFNKYILRVQQIKKARQFIKKIFFNINDIPDIIYDIHVPSQKRIVLYEKMAKKKKPSVLYRSTEQVLSFFSDLKEPLDRISFLSLFLAYFSIPRNYVCRNHFSWLLSSRNQDVIDIKKRLYLYYNVKKPFIFLVPQASRTKKELPISFWYQLVKTLKEKGITSVMAPFNDGREKTLYRQSLEAIPDLIFFQRENNQCACAEHDAIIIKESMYVIGVDTGITHLAALMGKKGIIFFHKKRSAWITSISRTSFDFMFSVPSISHILQMLSLK